MQLAAKGMKDPEEAGAAASNYLNVFGLTALAFVWVVMARAAIDQTTRFERVKIKTARYFFSNVLPEIDSLVAVIGAGKAQMMAFDDDEF